MEVFPFLALVCFLAAAIWSAIQRSWPTALLSLGLVFVVLAGTSLIHT